MKGCGAVWPLTVPQAPQPHRPEKMGSCGFGVHLGTPQGGDGRCPNTTAEAAAASQPITTVSQRAHPVNCPQIPEQRKERKGGRRAGILPASFPAPTNGPGCCQQLEHPSAPLGAPNPPPPGLLLSSSGRQPQMFEKTNCRGISSQVFPQFCPL